MSSLVSILVVFLVVLVACEAKSVHNHVEKFEALMRSCPNITITPVDLKDFDGVWYLQIYQNEGNSEANCAKDHFSLNPESASSNVVSSFESNGKYGEITTVWEEVEKGRFAYHLKELPIFLVRVAVAAFDKDVGFVIDTCMLEALEELHFQVFTKEKNPDPKDVENLLQKAKLAGVEMKNAKGVKHEDCLN